MVVGQEIMRSVLYLISRQTQVGHAATQKQFSTIYRTHRIQQSSPRAVAIVESKIPHNLWSRKVKSVVRGEIVVIPAARSTGQMFYPQSYTHTYHVHLFRFFTHCQ